MDQPILKTKSEQTDRQADVARILLEGDADLLLENVQRLAGIGMLTAGVSQELANLLSIITTASISLRHELQLQDSPHDDTIQHLVNLIERNAFRSARIVSMLQKYGSIGAPQMAITDVDTILRDALMLVERQFREECNVRIAVNAPGETQSIVCDHDRVVQLLVNLLLNARDSMNTRDSMKETGGPQIPAGLIEVKVLPLDEVDTAVLPDMDGRLPEEGDHMLISISDEGPGISPEVEEQLFKPFYSASPGSSGVCLGLSIAWQIVEQHHGDIWFSNNGGPTMGASVTVVLPLRPD